MPNYFYKAKNVKGKEKSGVLFAESVSDLANSLSKDGYFLISAKKAEKRGLSRAHLKLFGFNSLKLFKIPLSEKLFFTRNLEVMIRTGVPLPRAFEILSNQTKNKNFKIILDKISEMITQGKGISECLSKFPNTFSALYVETVKAGEETGKIENSFSILGSQMERTYRLKSQLKSAMMYPIIVLSLGIIIGVLMMIFVVPKILETFKEMNVQLPLSTRMLIASIDIITKHWLLVLIGFFFLIVILFYFAKSKKGVKFKAKIALKIPKISKIIKDTNSALFLRILSSLLAAGVPIVRSLEVTSGALSNFYFRQSLKEASAVVKKGKKLSEALSPYNNLYSSMVIEMLKVGEETGETAQVLNNLSDFYEEEVASSIKKISSIVEPALIAIMGVGVGFFAFAMLKPMLSVMGGM